jgi:molybdate transport system permease protein
MSHCSWGIVYRSGAIHSDKVKIEHLFAENLHAPIHFTAACTAGSDKGERLLDYLTGSEVGRLLVDAGFSLEFGNDALTPETSFLRPAVYANERQAIFLSLKVASACTLFAAVPGILLGCLLARKNFPGQSLVNAIVFLPLVLPPVVTGYAALALLGRQSLLGGWLFNMFGISVAFTQLGAVVVAAVMGLPLLVRSVKTAVEMIDHRYALAASTLGAGPIRNFLTITLPMAGPGILAGMILAFARSLGEFGATAVFAGNLPGKTQTLSLAVYSFIQTPGAETVAMRLVLISILISFASILLSEMLARKMKPVGITP